MHNEDDIKAMVEATLQVADQVSHVPPPAGIKAQVMQRVNALPQGQSRPLWLRPAIAVAAAVLVLAVNWLAISSFISSRSNAGGAVDPLEQIRTEYSLNNADY
jgi:hypothetical protein